MTFARLDEAMRGRRSIRRYAEREVPDSLVRELLDLSRHAPSSMDGQPWVFVVIRSDETKRKRAALKNAHCAVEKQAAFPADFLSAAPVIVAVCVERGRSHDRERENGALAAAHLLLAAHARGLGGVYLTARGPTSAALAGEIRALLNLPSDVEPEALIPLGFPADVPAPKRLRSLEEMIHYETYGPGGVAT
jgi:nitroreductase